MKKNVLVTIEVEVEIDESKFTEQFMEEFRASFYNFRTIDDHICHLGQLEARALIRDFTEGYGPLEDMGIKTRTGKYRAELEDE